MCSLVNTMNQKELRIELKRLLNIDVKHSKCKESEYPNLEKLVSKLTIKKGK